jgi:hypothetical protein
VQRFTSRHTPKTPTQQASDSSIFGDDSPIDENPIEELERRATFEEPKLLWYLRDHSQRWTDPSSVHGIDKRDDPANSRCHLLGPPAASPSVGDFAAMSHMEPPQLPTPPREFLFENFENEVADQRNCYPMIPLDHDTNTGSSMDESPGENSHLTLYDFSRVSGLLQDPIPISQHQSDLSQIGIQEDIFHQMLLHQSESPHGGPTQGMSHHHAGPNTPLGYMDHRTAVGSRDDFDSDWRHR